MAGIQLIWSSVSVHQCLLDNATPEVDKNTAQSTKDRKREGQRERERLMLMGSANLQLAAVVSRALICL